MSDSIEINGRSIGPGKRVYVIAELSANHNQDCSQAVRIIEAAKRAGADAVKLQTYTPDTISIQSDKEYFRVKGGTLWDGKTLYELYQQAYTPWEWQPGLMKITNDLGMDFFSSAFDHTAVDFLENMKVPAHKLASFEVVDLPLIEKMAATGKPLIMSTGMAGLEEIEEAVATARKAGATEIALLKCNSAYPSPPEDMNLRTIPEMARRFNVPVGLSDHTLGITAAVTSVALGACIIEKHLTLSRATPGPRQRFLAPARRIQSDGRRRPDRRKSAGQRILRLQRERASQPPLPALALRRPRCEARRTLHPRERALHPAG